MQGSGVATGRRAYGGLEGLTMSAHGSLVGSLLLTMVICLPLTDTWLSSMTLHTQRAHKNPVIS